MTDRDTPSPPYAILLLSAGAGLMLGLILAIPPWPQVTGYGPVEKGEIREQEMRLEQQEESKPQ